MTKDWKNCQALTNSNKLRKSVRLFDVNELHPEIASRAKSILQKFRLEDVAECSEGAACFYAWVRIIPCVKCPYFLGVNFMMSCSLTGNPTEGHTVTLNQATK